MRARLFSKTGETRDTELDLGSETIIGRDRQSALVIDLPLMSSRHARIFYDQDQSRFMIEDLGSLNGTELDGDRVTGPERLGHLHVITFADTYEFFFQDLERYASRQPAPQGAQVVEPSSANPGSPEPETAESPSVLPTAAGSTETTSVERQPVALPDLLARRADDAGGQSTDEAPHQRPFEITKIEREPAILPAALARVVEQAEVENKGLEADRGEHGTVFEKLPVALPGNLAQRAIQADQDSDAKPNPDVHKLETVDLDDIEELIAADSEPEPADVAAGHSAKAASDLQLIVTEPDGKVRHFALESGENLIGRGTRVQVSMIYRDLSRRHAVLRVGEDKITIRDLRSRNRTYLDDFKLEPETEVEIEVGARLRFGSVEARLAKVSVTSLESGDS